jgi:two-component system, NtrC family, sensor kinase
VEDTSYSRTQKSYFSLSGLNSSNTKEECSNLFDFKQNKDSSYSVQFEDSFFKINKENISPALLYSKRSQKSIAKQLVSNLKLTQKLTRLSQQAKKNLLSDKTFFSLNEKDLHRFFRKVHNIYDFPPFLLTHDLLKGFISTQLFIHEKGKSSAKTFSFSNGSKSKEKNLSAEKFLNLFNLIKKSKNKDFSQTTLNSHDIDMTGTFLAKELSYLNRNLIILISRNDLFNPTKEESIIFNDLINYFKPFLEPLLSQRQSDIKSSTLLKALNHFPYPLLLINKLGQALFSNPAYSKHEGQGDHFKIKEYKYSLPNSHTLYFLMPNNFSSEADFYHFKRLSLLGELLNTLRHELSNPLFGLKLAADILKSESENEENTELLNDVLDSADRCQLIIKNFSDLYGSHENTEELNLYQLINKTVILTKSETKGIRKVITLNSNIIHLNDDSINIPININGTYISQIVFNLIINSAQALRENDPYFDNSPKIELAIIENGPSITITCKDNGPGIPKDKREKIFEPFFTTKSQGTGLGLAICSSLVKRINGSLQLLPDKEGGAIFVFKFAREIK